MACNACLPGLAHQSTLLPYARAWMHMHHSHCTPGNQDEGAGALCCLESPSLEPLQAHVDKEGRHTNIANASKGAVSATCDCRDISHTPCDNKWGALIRLSHRLAVRLHAAPKIGRRNTQPECCPAEKTSIMSKPYNMVTSSNTPLLTAYC